MSKSSKESPYSSAREKFLGLSLESTRKSYYPQLQKQLEAAKENERRLQLLIDNLPARISFVSMDERYETVNFEYEKIFKIPREQIVGEKISSVIGPENYEKTRDYIRRALAGEQVQFETEFIVTGGEIQWHEMSFIPVINGAGGVDGFYVLALDITEKRRALKEREKLQGKLREAQKLNAIGTLAGGIAHDFNNLLMGIQGRISLISVELEDSHPLNEHALAIEQHIQSATDLTRQLLGFARGGKYEVKPTDLNELVRNTAKMFGRTRKELRIHELLSDSVLVVEVDRRQIEQVLLNLFVNSWQAMAEGGDLYLETTQIIIDDILHQVYEVPPGTYARISITDTGTGMPESVRQRVFDPFFTTKTKQRGTGLGLASAYGIIKNHKGAITVYSEPGEGSTFSIYLPITEKEPYYENHLSETIQKGTETVLLVDDEKIICDVTKVMLETIGYQVIAVNSGREAVEVVRSMGSAIDLVLLDLIMPDMDGGKTFDLIRELQPELAVILSSGYSINGQAAEIINRGCNGFIQKPFNIAELSKQVRKALGQYD